MKISAVAIALAATVAPASAMSKSKDDSICGSCPFDTFYQYQDGGRFAPGLRDAFKNPPGQCVLAAVRDEVSRRGIQYAIPEGKIALTQGFFPTDDYLEFCEKEDELTLDGEVVSCHDEDGHPKPYREFFVNYEGTDVPSGDHIWDHDEFPLDDGLLNVAIGADGILRPIKIWLEGSEENKNGFDGAVYECCPTEPRICNVVAPVN